jgi:acyl-CoA thioesterase FadM
MAQIIPSAYVDFRRYLALRDKVGHDAAVKQFKRERLESVLDYMVSCGEHQELVTEADCTVIVRRIDSQPDLTAKRADDPDERT